MPEDLGAFVADELHVAPEERVTIDGMLALGELSQLVALERPDLKFKPYKPRFPERIRDQGGGLFRGESARRTSSSTTLTNPSTRWCSFSTRRRATRRSWRSSRHSTAPPNQLTHHRRSGGSRRCRQIGHGPGRAEGAVRRVRPISAGLAIWSAPMPRWSSASFELKTHAKLSDGRAPRGRPARHLLPMSAPAITTRSPRGSTRTCPISPPIL